MDNEFEINKLLYEETSKVAHTFWEWRHKVMTRFFVSVGALIIAAGWLLKNTSLERWAFVPIALISVFSLISYFLDKINTWVLKECYTQGQEVEQRKSRGQPA